MPSVFEFDPVRALLADDIGECKCIINDHLNEVLCSNDRDIRVLAVDIIRKLDILARSRYADEDLEGEGLENWVGVVVTRIILPDLVKLRRMFREGAKVG